jgi:glycosyltransferase involved in cell wall biosynthesis
MRIGWATPFNVRSAIGKYSRMVCEELQLRGYEVDIIRTESGAELDEEALEVDLEVIDAAAADVDRYDALIVNFGNHAPYHAGMLHLFGKRAPIGIFHDMEMRDFEWGMTHRHALTIPRMIGVVQDLAGTSHSDMVDPANRPLLATLAAMTCGAVLHGPHYRETIAHFCPGPVAIIPLCYPNAGGEGPHGTQGARSEPGAQASRRGARPSRAALRVTIFGVINQNKQPDRVIEALALLRPRLADVELHLAGAIDDRERAALSERAAALGIAPPIFHGYVTDRKLQEIIEASHAVCCLRYPVSEGGSASMVTAMYRGRPLIVSDVASYAMVPDDLVSKVSYGKDPGDLAEALLAILSNPERADRRAAEARTWAIDRFSAHAYVDALEPVLRGSQSVALLTRAALQLVPAITTGAHEPLPIAVEGFAEALDWMDASQGSGR